MYLACCGSFPYDRLSISDLIIAHLACFVKFVLISIVLVLRLCYNRSKKYYGGTGMENTQWYKEMIVYQIWPRSFCDGNGDGIGDLWGVLSKLDYIRSLGVNAIWFSPLYPSPNADYGYDISDYKNIHPDFGDLDVFRQVLDGAHRRGMRVFMDLVVNHTSDEHHWFRESRKGKDNPYHDYYYWRPARKGPFGLRLPPNNWTSMFEGGAWEYDKSLDEYYLHLFAKKQPDLDMSNPKVREEVKSILRFWLDMGVDGFREDVITFIGKAPGLPDSYPWIPMANGMKYFSNQPQVLDYLREFKRDVLDYYDCFTVGESALTDAEMALRYVEEPENVLDEVITFSHMEADCFMTDAIQRPFDLVKMKKAFTDWQTKLYGRGWNSLYLENHDHPRIISRYGSERYRVESGKMLAAMYMLMCGTPFIYQGQEIGMTNHPLPELSMYKDVSSFNTARMLSKLLPKKKVLEQVQKSSRDNARTPMQWSDDENAGFTSGTPWFGVNPNYTEINVRSQEDDPASLLNFYRSLIEFRKGHPLAVYGRYNELMPKDKSFYVYERCYQGQRLLVICAFTKEQLRFDAPEGYELEKGQLVFSNYPRNYIISNGFTIRPYELRVYLYE